MKSADRDNDYKDDWEWTYYDPPIWDLLDFGDVLIMLWTIVVMCLVWNAYKDEPTPPVYQKEPLEYKTQQ